MSVTFRIATAADDRDGPTAAITTCQLAAFRTFLREQGERYGIVLADPDPDERGFLPNHLEARVCPVALATIARLFDYDEAVITVVEEAQFRRRRISVYPVDQASTLAMGIALTSDLGHELDLASNNAFALLESLGLRPDSVGEIPVHAVLARLSHPAVRRRAMAEGTSTYLDRLDRLLATADPDDAPRLEWA
ncbi:hypothetical protein [uncultured Sphingomonas sp.]|uniref:hypothetical protein n=1 Tax=uncultured Sphingomonas sp. TaxID=158754 RepID=UPI002609C653|nr:hypothetical protein [uncultured Sphingomonas sp.]